MNICARDIFIDFADNCLSLVFAPRANVNPSFMANQLDNGSFPSEFAGLLVSQVYNENIGFLGNLHAGITAGDKIYLALQ